MTGRRLLISGAAHNAKAKTMQTETNSGRIGTAMETGGEFTLNSTPLWSVARGPLCRRRSHSGLILGWILTGGACYLMAGVI